LVWLPTDTSQGDAAVVYPQRAGEPLRVEFSGPPSENPHKHVLRRYSLPVTAGHAYSFELRARSNGARSLQYTLNQDHAPWENLGLKGGIELGPEWRQVRRTFVAAKDEHRTYLELIVGGDNQAVEIADEPVVRELSGAVAAEALATLKQPAWKLSSIS